MVGPVVVMIAITPHMRILVAVEPLDFRKGIDGLVRVCRELLASDPFSGAIFIFRSRQAKAIRLLSYDGQGFWLCQKRLSEGRFRHWPGEEGEASRRLAVHELQLLLWNGDPTAVKVGRLWKAIPVNA